MNVICEARHFCLWSSDTDKSFSWKQACYLILGSNLIQESSHPLDPKNPNLLAPQTKYTIFPAEWTQWTSCSVSATRPKSYSRESRLWGGRWDPNYPGLDCLLLFKVDNPMHLLDVGQEAIVLSGLNKHASESLKNIKNLYDETKYLKTYLEKLEAKVL